MLDELKRLMEAYEKISKDRGVDWELRLDVRTQLYKAAHNALPDLVAVATAVKNEMDAEWDMPESVRAALVRLDGRKG